MIGTVPLSATELGANDTGRYRVFPHHTVNNPYDGSSNRHQIR